MQNSSNLSLSVNKQELKKIKQNYLVSNYGKNPVLKTFFVLKIIYTECHVFEIPIPFHSFDIFIYHVYFPFLSFNAPEVIMSKGYMMPKLISGV